MGNKNLPKLTHDDLRCNKIPTQDPSYGNLDQFGQKELVHVGSLVSHASNLWPKPARE